MVVRGREGWNTSAGYFVDDSQQLLEQLNISTIIGIIVQGKEEVTNDMLSTSTLQNRFMLTVIHFPTVFIMVVSWRWKLFSPSLWSAGNASWVIATTMALKCAQKQDTLPQDCQSIVLQWRKRADEHAKILRRQFWQVEFMALQDKKLELIPSSKEVIFSIRYGNEKFSVLEDNLKIHSHGSTGSELRSLILKGTHTVDFKSIPNLLLKAGNDALTIIYLAVIFEAMSSVSPGCGISSCYYDTSLTVVGGAIERLVHPCCPQLQTAGNHKRSLPRQMRCTLGNVRPASIGSLDKFSKGDSFNWVFPAYYKHIGILKGAYTVFGNTILGLLLMDGSGVFTSIYPDVNSTYIDLGVEDYMGRISYGIREQAATAMHLFSPAHSIFLSSILEDKDDLKGWDLSCPMSYRAPLYKGSLGVVTTVSVCLAHVPFYYIPKENRI
ncbi:uncharacterized protein LOC113286891 [Papaver somniferum]|uniref:uncharacterized protein LOC113286891 n=1 Tax=Papaver somniferum TaxID=3469 RepID=UPI000E7049AA|nr:uncharacterized protein LOC113286891 [Papaver somniferum]XP_026391313.1 uncharacterized protein LOC113286891 [Papaver somniferum]XP_026391314.1 uncharacterized protein LOC113286891 [Papaver somniferum]